MSYAEIHLKGGSVVRFEATRLKIEASSIPGKLISIEWDQPEDARVRPVGLSLDDIAAAVLVDEELFPMAKMADHLAKPAEGVAPE